MSKNSPNIFSFAISPCNILRFFAILRSIAKKFAVWVYVYIYYTFCIVIRFANAKELENLFLWMHCQCDSKIAGYISYLPFTSLNHLFGMFLCKRTRMFLCALFKMMLSQKDNMSGSPWQFYFLSYKPYVPLITLQDRKRIYDLYFKSKLK